VSFLSAIILGIVQGFTEFLPVSSSGHLVLGQALLGISLPGITFEITVHLATLCAVLWVYRGRVASLAAGAVRGDRASWTYIGLLALASVPAGLVGWLARDWFESAFGRPVVAAALLLLTGFLVYSVRFTASRAKDPAPCDPRSRAPATRRWRRGGRGTGICGSRRGLRRGAGVGCGSDTSIRPDVGGWSVPPVCLVLLGCRHGVPRGGCLFARAQVSDGSGRHAVEAADVF